MITIGQPYRRFTIVHTSGTISTEPDTEGFNPGPEDPLPILAAWDGTALHVTWTDGSICLYPAHAIRGIEFHGAADQ